MQPGALGTLILCQLVLMLIAPLLPVTSVCAGYSLVQRNVTRLCDSYVPAGCNEQCVLQTVEDILAAEAAGSGSNQQLVSTVVPAVVVSTGRSCMGVRSYISRRKQLGTRRVQSMVAAHR
jgi:hypothetical protein